MTRGENISIDELIERSTPSTIVLAAAATLASEGLFLLLLGLQSFVFMMPQGWVLLVPITQSLLGVLSIGAAYLFGRAHPVAPSLGILTAALVTLLTGLWLIVSFLAGYFSLLSLMTFPLAIASLVMIAISLGPCRDSAKAWKQLIEIELKDTEHGQRYLEEMRSARKRLVGVFLSIGVVATIVVAVFVWVTRTMPGRPTRVVLVQHGGIDVRTDSELMGRARHELEAYGFETIVHEEPILGADLVSEAREVARSVEAANAVIIEPSARQERDGSVPGTSLFAVNLDVHLVSELNDSSPPDDLRSRSMEFAFDEATAPEVAHRVNPTWTSALMPWVVDWIYESESFQPVLDGDVTFDELSFATKLRDIASAVEERRKLAGGFDQFCARERARLDTLVKGETRPIQCVGDPCKQYTLIGVDDRSRAIVQDMSRTPIFKIPPPGSNSWAEPPERLLALDEEGHEEVIFRAGHFFGFGHLTSNGRNATVQPFGINGLLSIYSLDVSTKAVLNKTILAQRERTSYVLPQPLGDSVIAKISRGPWVLIRGSQRLDLPIFIHVRWVVINGAPMIAGQTQEKELLVMTADGSTEIVRMEMNGRVENIFDATADRLFVALRNEMGCELIAVDHSSGEIVDQTQLPQCFDELSRLPDGRLVGTGEATTDGDVPGDPEVVVFDPQSGALTQITTGHYIEEAVHPTHDGGRIVFNRRLEDWPEEYNLRIYRRVVCWADIPPR